VNYHARFHDLVIIGQTNPDDSHAIGAGFVSDVVLGAGRPVLVIPYIGPHPTLGRQVLVAWDGSREATRAMHDALPLLAAAERVLMLTINNEDSTEAESSGVAMCGRLVQRGIAATTQHLPLDAVNVGDLLLDRAADEGFDLIVMGAYGHTRLREIVLGGTTRQLLNHMTVPVLLSH
jgi:nucleotide-binding universal stress UspA family protein